LFQAKISFFLELVALSKVKEMKNNEKLGSRSRSQPKSGK